MSNHPSLDGLGERLRRRGLPAAYVARLLGEFEDHVEDLLMQEEPMSKEALTQRIGDIEELAAAAEYEYRQRTIVGRHPVLTFLIAPVPAVLVGWALFVLGSLAVFGATPLVLGSDFAVDGKPATQWPSAMITLANVLHQAGRFFPPALVALLFWRLASRSGLSWRWSLAACLLVALLAGAYTSEMQLPLETGRGRLAIGLGVSLCPTLLQWAQLAVPALIGLLSAWQLASAQREPRTAYPVEE